MLIMLHDNVHGKEISMNLSALSMPESKTIQWFNLGTAREFYNYSRLNVIAKDFFSNTDHRLRPSNEAGPERGREDLHRYSGVRRARDSGARAGRLLHGHVGRGSAVLRAVSIILLYRAVNNLHYNVNWHKFTYSLDLGCFKVQQSVEVM